MEEDEKTAFESYESISTITSVEEEEYKLEEKLTKEGILKITKELIEKVQQELCLIKLCWPEIDYTKDLYLRRLPSSYCTLSDKEKLLAWYAENFRQQFHVKYPKRKPLLLVCENECGIQKFMSTTIKRSTLPYPELYTWQECGKFVSDYVKYEPLNKPLKMPKQVRSPTWVQKFRKGNCFECATFLTSLLLGQGYNAFVVSGYASREQALCDLTRRSCPYIPQPEKKFQEDTIRPEITKYKLNLNVEYKNQFLSESEEEKARKLQEKLLIAEKEQQNLIEELEQLPVDEYWGHRIHAWVAILPELGGLRDEEIPCPLFIEPTTGVSYEVTDDDTAQLYLGVESIWNDQNYWVNMQVSVQSCVNIEWDLMKVELWEHLLPGEPWTTHAGEIDEESAMRQEKHLDMPLSYVNQINISEEEFEKRFPNGMKIVLYKKTKVEFYAPYIQTDGLIQRITTYDNDMNPIDIYENYRNRSDNLIESRRNMVDGTVIDYYTRGRVDQCKGV